MKNNSNKLTHTMAQELSKMRGLATITSSVKPDSFIATYEGVAYKVSLKPIAEVEKEEEVISETLKNQLFSLADDFLK